MFIAIIRKEKEPMNQNLSRFLFLVVLLISSAYAVKVGESAPDLQATDSNGQAHRLSQYRSKFVVLEWHNNGCPYTRKHYESGNMQRLQKEWTGKGVAGSPSSLLRLASKGMLQLNRKMTTSNK
jgi:hypothetical protein